MSDPFDDLDRATFEAAVRAWGLSAQVDMAVEECGELIVALSQYQRGRVEREDVVDEVADVRIMFEQLRAFTNPEAVDERVAEKMDRLRERLPEGVNVGAGYPWGGGPGQYAADVEDAREDDG